MEKVLKWGGFGICVMCMLATSANYYPTNVVLGIVGNGLWTTAGYMSKDTPLWVSSLFSTAIFVGGVFLYFLKG